jgi:hypothetical protein
MKVTTVGRSNYSLIFIALAALGAVYFYRRQGGSLRALFDRGVGMIKPVSDSIMHRVSPVVSSPTTSSTAPNATI